MSMNYLDRAQYNLIYIARSVSFHYRFGSNQLESALKNLVQTVDNYEAVRNYYPVIPALPPEDSALHPLAKAQLASESGQLIQPYCYGVAFRDPRRYIEDTHIEFSPALPFRITTLFAWGVGKVTLTSMTVNADEQFKNGGGMPGELFEPGMTLQQFLKFLTPDIGLGTEATWVPGWKLKSMPHYSTSVEMPTVALGGRIRTAFKGKLNALFWIGESAIEEARDEPITKEVAAPTACKQCTMVRDDLEAISVGGQVVAYVCPPCKAEASSSILRALTGGEIPDSRPTGE